jgi:hypothetical protein
VNETIHRNGTETTSRPVLVHVEREPMLPFAAVAEMDHEAGVGIDLGVSLRLVSSYED